MLSNLFICASYEKNEFEKHIPAPLFRRRFTLSRRQSAEVTVCGLGFYELYINGEKITKGRLAPYISNPDDVVYYDKYDLTDYIRSGENVIGVCLGNGLLNTPGGKTWDFDKAAFRSVPKLAIHFSSDEVRFEADEKFKVFPSPITFDDYRCGEFYDARREIDGWSLPGFNDSDWKAPLKAEAPKGIRRYCTAEPIREFDRIAPVSIEKTDEGFLYDFGINDSGVCRLKINGEAGQEVTLRHGEQLVDGKFCDKAAFFQPEGYRQTDRYICKGGGIESHTPAFTYHGFRYVLVSGTTDEQATPELLTFVTVHSDIKKRGSFECSNPEINKIEELCEHSDISNFHYFPTDCPQREKNGWTADICLSAEQLLMNFAAEKSLKFWVRNLCLAQKEDGRLPGIVPTGGWGFDWGNGPGWDQALTLVPYYIMTYTGDSSSAEEAVPYILNYLKYLDSRKDERGLLSIGLGDWCPPDRAKEDDFDAPVEVTDSMIAMEIAKKAVVIFRKTKKGDLKYAQTFATEMRKSIRAHLIEGDTVKGNCQTCQAMGLYYGCFEKDEEPAALEKLIELCEQKDMHFDTGVLGGRVLYEALSKYGRSDLALKMILNPSFPSYANYAAGDVSTLPEWFLSEPRPTASYNHHFWGFISGWFYRQLGGIKIPEREISPYFAKETDFVNATVDGISVKWSRQHGKIILKIVTDRQMTLKIRDNYKETLKPGEHRYMFEG